MGKSKQNGSMPAAMESEAKAALSAVALAVIRELAVSMARADHDEMLRKQIPAYADGNFGVEPAIIGGSDDKPSTHHLGMATRSQAIDKRT